MHHTRRNIEAGENGLEGRADTGVHQCFRSGTPEPINSNNIKEELASLSF
jgi:hypothetical protein